MKTYRSEWVKCGRKSCGSCPHGPYWYAYWKVKGKLHKEYIGKELPREDAKKGRAEDKPHPWEAMLHEQTASAKLAFHILGVAHGADYATCRAAYRQLAKDNHPDRGGDQKRSCCISSAWSYLRKAYRWS